MPDETDSAHQAGSRHPEDSSAARPPARESDLRLLFENMDSAFALHEIVRDARGQAIDYRYLLANPAFQRLTGRNDIVGRTVRQLLPHIEPPRIDCFGRVAATGQPDEFEDYVAHLRRWYSVRVFCPQPDRFALLYHDITERKAEQDRLRSSEERYRILFRQNADAVFVHLADPGGRGRFVEVNDVACERLGYTREEMLGMSAAEIDGTPADERIASIVRRLTRGEPVTFEQVHVARSGRRIPVEIHAQAIDLQGRLAILSVVRDISERRRIEEERLSLERNVLQTQKLESLGILAGGIAHDFNNILMAILGNADLAREDIPAASPARENLADIEKAARRAADLCRQMLAYSGKGRFVTEALDVNAIVAEMTHMIRGSISKKVVLRANLADDLPAIEADVTQMRQVVMNLLLNAAEACGDGDGAVSVTTGVMDCDEACLETAWLKEPRPSGRYVCMEVSDNGCGIPAETWPRIFDPFYTTKSTGRGLGLAAVLGIVRGHRGAMKLASEPGKGTTFTLLFPAVGRPAGTGAAAAAAPAAYPVRGGGATVLVVDDEKDSRMIATRMLKRLGFAVLTASDGREGVERFAQWADDIACVLLDLTMPRMDGAEAFRELCRIRPGVRVILSSGYSEQDVAQRFAGGAPAGFLQKPYQLADLAVVIKSVLGDARPAAAARPLPSPARSGPERR